MNAINHHEHSSDWKLAMDAISIYIKGMDQIFPSTASGYCILLHALNKNWNMNFLFKELKLQSDQAEMEESYLPFWWKEWKDLLENLEDKFEISFSKIKEIEEIKNDKIYKTKTQFNPNLSIEKIAEAVSRLKSDDELSDHFYKWETIVLEDDGKLNNWSSILIEQTKYVLNHLPISSFLRDGHCILKSLDRKFGKISIEDAIAYNYKIKNIDTDEILESFDTLDELIDAGWVVD